MRCDRNRQCCKDVRGPNSMICSLEDRELLLAVAHQSTSDSLVYMVWCAWCGLLLSGSDRLCPTVYIVAGLSAVPRNCEQQRTPLHILSDTFCAVWHCHTDIAESTMSAWRWHCGQKVQFCAVSICNLQAIENRALSILHLGSQFCSRYRGDTPLREGRSLVLVEGPLNGATDFAIACVCFCICSSMHTPAFGRPCGSTAIRRST